MLTHTQISNFLENDIEAIHTPPPIDDFNGYYTRRMSIEFKRRYNRRFGQVIYVERPFHFEEIENRDGGTNELKTYDDWDEATWVSRGQKEIIQAYASTLENAQYHLKAIEDNNHGSE